MKRYGGQSPSFRTGAKDALDVCLHDFALLEEVEVTALLMVAASESVGSLSQARIDELLGLPVAPQPSTPSQPGPVALEAVLSGSSIE